MYDIIIIGAGPAGLTSAIYAARSNKKVLVLEALTYGGQIINAKKSAEVTMSLRVFLINIRVR